MGDFDLFALARRESSVRYHPFLILNLTLSALIVFLPVILNFVQDDKSIKGAQCAEGTLPGG